MGYLTAKQFSEKWGISERRIIKLCNANRISGAIKNGMIWVIPEDTIKPIDKEMIIKCAKETKKLISIEDHSVINGLGSAIADVLAQEYPKKLVKIGMNDEFGKSGKAGELLRYFKLTPEHIIEEVKK